jgi:ATP-binding cassette, subfamily B, bacterial
VRATLSQLARAAPLPCIVHWKQRHFVVVYQVSHKAVSVADPEQGLLTYAPEEFVRNWSSNTGRAGVALLLKPTAEFFKQQAENSSIVSGWRFLRPYLTPYRVSAFYLLLGLLLGSAIQLALPFLSQMLVDVGIGQRNLHFMTVVLAAQLMLFASRTGIDMLRRRMLLRLGTRLHVALLSDFLQKLMRLPLSFFDAKTQGDLLQRIDDHERIEDFLTTSALSILFSLINLLVFSVVLAWYHLTIFGIFCIGSVCYVVWGSLFLRKRRQLDFARFDRMAEHQGKILDIINGIRDIKVNTCDVQQQQEWAAIQEKLFKTNVNALTLSQFQEIGMTGINQFQNIVITSLSVKAVLDGGMTLGMVLAVQYMLGQLQSPIEHLIEFFHTPRKMPRSAWSAFEKFINSRTKKHSRMNVLTPFRSKRQYA